MDQDEAVLRSFDELFDLRRLEAPNEFIRGTVVAIYILKEGLCRVLLEDDSASGLERSYITCSPFDSYSDKQRIFVTIVTEISTLLSIPSRHDKLLISGPLKVENCMITHQDEMHPHIFITTTGLVSHCMRLIFYIKSLKEAVHLQLVSSSSGTRIINPVARTCRLTDIEGNGIGMSNGNPLLAINSMVETVLLDKPDKHRQHSYSQLSALLPNTIVDFIGIIVEWSEPRACQGKGLPLILFHRSDLFMKIFVVDHSLEQSSPFAINLFLKSHMDFPQIVSPGEIIRMHRIKVQGYKGELLGLNTKGFSFVVISDSLEPRPSVSRHASTTPVTELDLHRISSLRNWWSKLCKTDDRPTWATFTNNLIMPETDPSVSTVVEKGRSFYFTPNFRKLKEVKDIRGGLYFDLIAEVIHICRMDEYENSEVMMTIVLTDYTENDRLRTMIAQGDTIKAYQDTIKNKLLCTFWDEHVSVARSTLQVGRIAYFKNLHARPVFPGNDSEEIIAVMHGCGLPASQSIITIDNPSFVSFCAPLLQRRELSEIMRPLITEPPSITKFQYSDIPFSALADIILSKEIPAVYRTRVRMVGFFPSNVHELSRPYCNECRYSWSLSVPNIDLHLQCPRCERPGNWNYLFGVIIQQPNLASCRLPLLCFSIDAERIFGAASNFYINSPERSFFINRLAALLSEVDGSSGPILDIGIRVYRRVRQKESLLIDNDNVEHHDSRIRYSLVSTDFNL